MSDIIWGFYLGGGFVLATIFWKESQGESVWWRLFWVVGIFAGWPFELWRWRANAKGQP